MSHERGKLTGKQLLSEIQAIRTQRARAGENPCFVQFDPSIAADLELGRIRSLEARRRRRMRRVLGQEIKP